MNNKVRKYLIDQCIKGKTVAYQTIMDMLSLGNSEHDRMLLGKELGSLSAFEHKHGRPLISCMATYQNNIGHADGFYRVCEDLGLGDAKKLKEKGYAYEEMEKCKTYWRNREKYDLYYEPRTTSVPSFFSKEDQMFYQGIITKKRRELSIEEERNLKAIFSKSNYWARQVAGNELSVKEDNNWQHSGNIRKYAWPKIYSQQDASKLIFFTMGFGVDGKLIYKLDCQRSEKMAQHLSHKQVERFDYMLRGTGANWVEIPLEVISRYDWDSLIAITKEFVNTHLPLYREVIDYVWGSDEPSTESEEFEFTFTELPDIPTEFKDRPPYFLSKNIPESINFDKQHKASKRIGDYGEAFVLEIEKRKVKKLGLIDFTPEKMADGKGYDILSRNSDGSELYIEVKTTLGGKSTPFHISQNEVEFLKRTPNACIYKVYGFKPKEKNGQVFKLNYTDLKRLNILPKEYKIYFD